MEDSRLRFSRLGCLAALIVFLGFTVSAAQNGGGENTGETAARCNADLSTFIPLPYSDTSNMVCKPVWNTYVVQVSFVGHSVDFFLILV